MNQLIDFFNSIEDPFVRFMAYFLMVGGPLGYIFIIGYGLYGDFKGSKKRKHKKKKKEVVLNAF